ncbi:Maf family protein [Exiguobacterium alkaliphilum]|uniref:dTTP/UTP pyrophosphatase n=1 Tax=Exiguobacterium alkaliphilum TaxID=1428684 RepID=A0ABT2KXS5_9BACL|nr:Maf family protein [Exiguobacterium alkaliphilum]MCT4795738.1 Maf family protein [Exiguobacterium alkaliphilum]
MKPTQKRVILASMSPRRTELLAKAGIHHEVIPSNVVEGVNGREAADEYVGRLAREKAINVARDNRDAVVIGSDTVVVLDGKILEKPNDREEARRMLRRLSGATHDVLTGVSIIGPERQDLFVTTTRVTFIDIPEAWFDGYLDSAEPYDKAGAYGIQGSGGLFVERLEGDYYNVVGLPLMPLVRTLEGHGVTPRFL